MSGSINKFSTSLIRWYDRHRRELPWRIPRDASASTRVNPYHVLLSEVMLQQTQVATVVPYFHRFIERFPTFKSLAEANSQDVLKRWEGLGYYSRASRLQETARAVVRELGGVLPKTVDDLLALPGIGRYTAGAIASIAFDQRAPILDGNVIRVLCRLDAIRTDPRSSSTLKTLWRRAEEILPKKRVGDFNSALMELGATVCLPRSPQCLMCPVRKFCKAFEFGIVDEIPPKKESKPTPLVRRWTIGIRHRDRWLIEQRPSTGRWASLWQFITVEPGENLKIETSPLRKIGSVNHALTHRRYKFDVFACEAKGIKLPTSERARQWRRMSELDRHPLSRPQLMIAKMLQESLEA